ncbi:MAG: radical SAM protein, partial [Nanoarchaeota archaeon]
WGKLGGLIDIIIRGEGELPLQKLIQIYDKFSNNKKIEKKKFLDYLKEETKINEISGMSILEENQTKPLAIVKERISPEFYQEISLNAFAKHLDLSPIGKYWELSRLIFGGKKDSYFRFVSSDHCPYKCIFCQSSILFSGTMGTKTSPVRYINAENILTIIEAVSTTYPAMDIYIDDENFLVHPQRAIETLGMIIERKKSGKIRKNLKFQCRARTDNIVSNPDICRLLKEAGFEVVSVGSESYSLKELEYMRKKTSPEKNSEAIKIIVDNGLKAAENYILYTPATTAETFYESALGICYNIGEMNVDGAATLFLTPLPGTDIWGDGIYEVKRTFPYQQELFKDKVMFHNKQSGYDYIGEEIVVPKLNIIFPHPEITLVNDSLMRTASIEALLHLPKAVEKLREITKKSELSRNFVTLANLFATSEALYNLTDDPKWKDLEEKIIRAAIKSKE